MIISFPKQVYVRSKKVLEACRKIACQHCNADNGTTVAAHSNWHQHGKGGHIKADDTRVAALCFECHMALDQGRLATKSQRQQAWWSAHCSTIRELTERGLWPAGVPVPDTSINPFEAEAA